MKKAFAIGLTVLFSLIMAGVSFAASNNCQVQLKVDDEVYVCGCGESCPCLTMSRILGKCVCGKDLVKSKVIKVEKGKVTVMVSGEEQAFPTKGKYTCICGSKCNCDTISQSPGKCGCGADMKAVEAAKPNAETEKAPVCGKGCTCEPCKTGKGECTCSKGSEGCNCGKDCRCGHCSSNAKQTELKKPVSDADYAKSTMSKKGSFKASYTSQPETMPLNTMISWKLKIETADGKPVKDAKIEVSGGMPEHGHGLPTKPKVTKDFGDGAYLVEGIKFSMPGWWTMTFAIKSGSTADSATFNLKLK